FAPGDPTTLGFIRIVTGLLILYSYLAYSLDLQAFFGRFGWYGTEYVERERHEYPWHYTSFTNWDDSVDALTRAPDFPHRRAPVIRFIRDLPESAGERDRSVEYLKRVAQSDSTTAVAGLNLAIRLYGTSASDRETLLTDGLLPGQQ